MNALKKAMRRIQDCQEARFTRMRRLIPCGDAELVKIEPSIHRGPAVTLRGGLIVRPGDPVAELHLDSRKIAANLEADPPLKARIALFRQGEASFAWIAGWLTGDARGRQMAALRGTTMLDREMRHFGFEVMPLPVWPWILIGCHMRWLSYIYRAETPRARRREPVPPLVKKLTPYQAWIGREEFLRKYSPDRPIR